MGLTVFDYDDDGDLDLFQGNDHQKNFLFRNDGQGNYENVAATAGVIVNDEGHPTGSMHGSIGDIDGDGQLDLLVVDLRHGALYRNTGAGLFEDVTASSGVKQSMRGKGAWAAAFFDYDNDGDLDIFSANGMADLLVDQDQLLLENDGRGRFTNVGPQRSPYFREKRSARGACVWDYDNDGDLDLIISHIDLKGTAALLRNDGGSRNHWLGIDLQAADGPADAIGAKVTVVTEKQKLVRVNQWATSYLSYNDPRIHFGLGDCSQIKEIKVRWGDGQVDVHRNVPADRYLTLVQGERIEVRH
jgi:hypothetical protein